jgi:hypothetical protein
MLRLMLSLTALVACGAAASAAPATRSAPLGEVTPSCKAPGLLFGAAASMRYALGCLLMKSAALDPESATLAEDLEAAFTGKVGRSTIRAVSKPLLAKWASEPASSLIPSKGSHALRIEETVITVGREGDPMRFSGQLVTEEGGTQKKRAIHGAFVMERGAQTLDELTIEPLAPPD